MNRLQRLRFTRAGATLGRTPAMGYVRSCADLAHKPSSYRGVLVRAHMRACGSIEHAASSVRSGWHLKG